MRLIGSEESSADRRLGLRDCLRRWIPFHGSSRGEGEAGGEMTPCLKRANEIRSSFLQQMSDVFKTPVIKRPRNK